jgi:hypothetical protein
MIGLPEGSDPTGISIVSQTGLLNAALFSATDNHSVIQGGVMTWYLGWQVAVVWLLAVALAAVIYFVPMTRFIDNLSDRSAVIADAE